MTALAVGVAPIVAILIALLLIVAVFVRERRASPPGNLAN